MNLNRRLLFIVDLAMMVVWSLIGYALIETYLPTAAFAVYIGAMLLGASVTGIIAMIYFYTTYREERKESLFPPEKKAPREMFSIRTYALRFVTANPRLSVMAKRMSERYEEGILRAGISESPYKLASEAVFFTIVAGAVALPLAIAVAAVAGTGIVAVDPVYSVAIVAAILISPAVFLAYPSLRLQNLRSERKKSLDDELPFFATYASIMQSVGLSLYNSMTSIIGSTIFPKLEAEALMLKRNVEFFFKNQVEVMDDSARVNPNEKMRTLLSGYSSVWRSGGDMSEFLAIKASDYLADMKFRWQKYANTVTDIGEVMVSLFFLLPMLVLTSAFLFPVEMEPVLVVTTFIIIPFLTLTSFFIVNGAQPKTYDDIHADWKPAALTGALVTGILGISSSFANPSILVAAAIISAALMYGLLVVGQRREVRDVEKALPAFLRDVTEYRKIGYDIQSAIIKLAEGTAYNSTFDERLKAVARQLTLELRLSEVEVKMRSWVGKVTFYLLGQIAESGGGSPTALDSLTNFVDETTRIKRETKSMMKMYEVLGYITPVGLAFAIALMTTLIHAFSGLLGIGGATGILGGITALPPIVTQLTNLMIIIASLSMGLLSSKAVDFTAKNTLKIAINVLIALIAISLSLYAAQSLVSAIGTAPAPSG